MLSEETSGGTCVLQHIKGSAYWKGRTAVEPRTIGGADEREIRGQKIKVRASTSRLRNHSTGPSIAMVLFQSLRAIDHWATMSAVTGRDCAR